MGIVFEDDVFVDDVMDILGDLVVMDDIGVIVFGLSFGIIWGVDDGMKDIDVG